MTQREAKTLVSSLVERGIELDTNFLADYAETDHATLTEAYHLAMV